MSTDFFKKYNAQMKQLSESLGRQQKLYHVDISLELNDTIEANSEEEAIQRFMEMFSSGDEMLEQYANITATEVKPKKAPPKNPNRFL